jgi:hypothetical protein
MDKMDVMNTEMSTSENFTNDSFNLIDEESTKPLSIQELQDTVIETSTLSQNNSNTITPSEPSRLEKLRSFQRTIHDQLRMVNNRIFDLETIYLEDTLHGNLIKGWEMDGRTAPLYRSRSIIDDKERLFSFSSHRYQQDRRLHPDLYVPANDRLPRLSAGAVGNAAPVQSQKQRKIGNGPSNTVAGNINKKRKTNEFSDEQQAYISWNALEDY